MEKSILGNFHGNEYEISVSVTDEALTLSLTSGENPKRWSNTFTKKDIEILTHRAKNAKRFNIFCKMLFASLNETSKSTLIDILSPYDMELIKSRKISERNSSFSQSKP